MTNTRDDLSLSRLDLIVLARLSSPKPPEPAELAEAVFKLALAESKARAKELALATFAALVERALVKQRPRVLTESGYRALRAALDLGHTPTWTEVRDAHLPALALGLRPGSENATKMLKGKETIAAAVLGREYGISSAPTLITVCDALILEALGLPPGPFDMDRVRAHVLARRAGVEAKGTAEDLAVRVAAKLVGARPANKKGMGPALARRWIGQAADTSGARSVQTAPRELVSPILAASPMPISPMPTSPAPEATALGPPGSLAQPGASEMLLTVVREAIPRISADGRFGPENIFVSALWRSIEGDRRLAELSLDRFKRWLVRANRDGWLVLARADLVGAMDARLVAESEIEDQGATFHFVLDHRAGSPGSEQGNHAR